MADLTAKRTLVKSPPELWSELSEVERLAKHLEGFGEIKITRLVPESTVAWEGETASGTVSIEPSGWGTKVTLTAQVDESAAAEVVAEPEPTVVEPEPEPTVVEPPVEEPPLEQPAAEEPAEPTAAEPEPVKQGFFARLFGRRAKDEAALPSEPTPEEPAAIDESARSEPVAPEPVAPEPVAVQPEPLPPEEPVTEASLDGQRAQGILEDALEALGSAHHRPFSRA